MAELFMECVEEELEPWQKNVEEKQDEDDDELIFVGEISSSKPAISSVPDAFKPTNPHYKDPTSNPVAALPRFHPQSKPSQSSIIQNVSKPVTIRASFGSHSKPSTPSSSDTPSTSSLQVSPPKSKNTTAKTSTKSSASKSKIRKAHSISSTRKLANSSKQGKGASKCKGKTSCKQKKQRNRKNKIIIALKNLRCYRGVHKCIECHSKIKDFASHFSIHIHCNFCKYNTNCNKAFINHMVRGITLVCLKCDFLTDSSGLDRMAKHLSQRKTHTCQVVIENGMYI
ncbi:Zinc finger protein 280C [Myotis davidii]|uniref:Zinc finger protein 280C n=1 Tax=Myotis davidii TaxID=225400 RepID=L5LI42_MYODS|nr:Zinc finger protein 280C [Myotis davidii]